MVATSTRTARARGDDRAAGARLAAEARLADLRQKLREALADRDARMKEFVEACKADRRAVREHVREMRLRSLRDLRDQIQSARGAAKLTRLTRLAEVRAVAGGAVQAARAAASVERAYQAELARLAREERTRHGEIRLAHERSLAAGALRSSLFGRLAPLFERQGRAAAPAPGESRAEAVLRFAERNPEKAHAVVEPGVHRKVEETKRAVAEAERSVRSAGGDVRVGMRRPSTEAREGRGREEGAAARPAENLQPASPPSNDTKVEPRPPPAVVPAERGGAGVSGAAAAAPDSSPPTAVPAKKNLPAATPGRLSRARARLRGAPPPARKKGELPRHGGMGLAEFLQERAERAASKRERAARKAAQPATKKLSTKAVPKTADSPPSTSVPAQSYAAWCELVSAAAAKHGRRVAFGPETHDAWRAGREAEAFALSLPGSGLVPTEKKPAPPSDGPAATVSSTRVDGVQPYKVRARCGHIVVRPMRAATAGVAYAPSVVLDAPKGRACDACEAKEKAGADGVKPALTKDHVKAPELRDTADIAKRIRADIAEAVRTKKLPKATYSVRTSKYSMGSSIDVVVARLPFPALNPAAFRLEPGSREASFDRDHFPSRYTPEAESVLTTLNAIVDAYHWDRSDPSRDLHHERFGRDVRLETTGKEWERINEARRAERTGTAPPSPSLSPVSGASAVPSPRPKGPPKASLPSDAAPKTPRGRGGHPGRSKTQQTLDTDSPLLAGAPRFASPTTSEPEGDGP
jgi:hypothetical protein